MNRLRHTDAIRSILYLSWCQARGRSIFKSYLLPLAILFGISYFLLIEEGSIKSFELWLNTLFILKGMPILALILSGGMFREEIKDSTIEYLWTRPTTRTGLVLGFYASAVLKTLVYGMAIALAIYLAGQLKGCQPDWADFPVIFLALSFSSLAYCAGGLLLATWTGKYMVLGISYGSVIEVGVGSIPTNLSKLSIMHHIEQLVAMDSLFALGNSLNSLLVCLCLTIVCVTAASAVFSFKTYHVGSEKEA